MLNKLRFGVIGLMMLCLAGCGTAIVGKPMAEPKCAVVGFEDLKPTDPGCGDTLDVPDIAQGYTARQVHLDGHDVLYIIDAEQNKAADLVPLTDDTVELRHYDHAVAYTVMREGDVDLVTIYASDTCNVEKLYVSPAADIKCGTDSDHGRALSRDEAATVLDPLMVNGIEVTALDSGRTTMYNLSVLTPDP